MFLDEASSCVLETLVKSITKGKSFNIGVVNAGQLYLMVNGGMLYTTNVADIVPMDLSYYFIEDVRVPFNPLYRYATDGINNMIKDRECCMTSKFSLVYDNPDIMEDINFQNILNAKSADGAFRYFIPVDGGNTFMYLTKGMFNLTKADNCTLRVFNGPGRYMANFHIIKKKVKRDIDIYFSFIDMMPKEKGAVYYA